MAHIVYLLLLAVSILSKLSFTQPFPTNGDSVTTPLFRILSELNSNGIAHEPGLNQLCNLHAAFTSIAAQLENLILSEGKHAEKLSSLNE